MGCNPLLGAARACENHVYIASSTHTDAAKNWMVSAIFGHDGGVLAQATEWGTVAWPKSISIVDCSGQAW